MDELDRLFLGGPEASDRRSSPRRWRAARARSPRRSRRPRSTCARQRPRRARRRRWRATGAAGRRGRSPRSRPRTAAGRGAARRPWRGRRRSRVAARRSRRESLRVPRRKTAAMGEIPYRAAIRTTSSRVGSPSSMARDARGGRQQLRRERVGLHLPRVRAAAAERLVRVDGDPGVVAAADVAELVREREAHAAPPACVPLTQSTARSPSRQQHPAIPSGSDTTATGSPSRSSTSVSSDPAGSAAARPSSVRSLARPLGPDVRVLPGHGAGP